MTSYHMFMSSNTDIILFKAVSYSKKLSPVSVAEAQENPKGNGTFSTEC